MIYSTQSRHSSESSSLSFNNWLNDLLVNIHYTVGRYESKGSDPSVESVEMWILIYFSQAFLLLELLSKFLPEKEKIGEKIQNNDGQ